MEPQDIDTNDVLQCAPDLHPSIKHFIPLFAYGHLPEHLAEMSKPFSVLAAKVMLSCSGPEASACLRKLLEAKDCAVRALLAEQL